MPLESTYNSMASLCTKVSRVQLMRQIPSVLLAGVGLKIELACCDEFNEPMSAQDPSLAASEKFELRLVCKETCTGHTEQLWDMEMEWSDTTTGRTVVCGHMPSFPGKYNLIVTARNALPGHLILPLQTDGFDIVSRAELQARRAGSSFIPKLLACYRPLSCDSAELAIKEEYGSTIGSHIYDSAIVLCRYVEENLTFVCPPQRTRRVLELGSGCGATGIWLATKLRLQRLRAENELTSDAAEPLNNTTTEEHCDVYLTDKTAQLPLLKYNVELNTSADVASSSVRAHCIALDWSCEDHINSFESLLAGLPLDLIMAGDVFYDLDAARLFVALVRRLAAPGITKVLVAQKLRANAEGVVVARMSEDDVRREFGFEQIEVVREEADVRLWLMTAS